MDAPNGNFHLTAESPAINRGTGTGAAADDFDCRPRVPPPDIGAYEYGAAPVVCSSLLPTYLLTVALAGSGSGAVISPAMGIDCGATCVVQASSGTLTAIPSPDSVLAFWSGCDSTLGLTCTLNAPVRPRMVTAIFSAGRRRRAVAH